MKRLDPYNGRQPTKEEAFAAAAKIQARGLRRWKQQQMERQRGEADHADPTERSA